MNTVNTQSSVLFNHKPQSEGLQVQKPDPNAHQPKPTAAYCCHQEEKKICFFSSKKTFFLDLDLLYVRTRYFFMWQWFIAACRRSSVLQLRLNYYPLILFLNCLSSLSCVHTGSDWLVALGFGADGWLLADNSGSGWLRNPLLYLLPGHNVSQQYSSSSFLDTPGGPTFGGRGIISVSSQLKSKALSTYEAICSSRTVCVALTVSAALLSFSSCVDAT